MHFVDRRKNIFKFFRNLFLALFFCMRDPWIKFGGKQGQQCGICKNLRHYYKNLY